MLYNFFFNDTATTEIYTLSLHDALPISGAHARVEGAVGERQSAGVFDVVESDPVLHPVRAGAPDAGLVVDADRLDGRHRRGARPDHTHRKPPRPRAELAHVVSPQPALAP